ncbi:hypothetical protein [Nitrosopumilus sp.]|uniref:hypothetical protein n=1 Tax=Nitrosopumilus sp. TaxID=2024843 RepID=UPI00292CCA44|nr:hypothetical protein [Nitrosopumilus sp.]
MKFKCYFCHSWMNDSHDVRMYDGRFVPSCLKCRKLVVDAAVVSDGNTSSLFETTREGLHDFC